MNNLPYPIHPAATIFPPLDEASYQKLKADIAENGLREDIALYDGQVVDGRNRLRALIELGIDPDGECCELSESVDPCAYAISVNLHRRQLSQKQRAVVGARMATLGHGQKKGDADTQSCISQDDAAGLLGVSVRSIQTARHVLENGCPELIALVEQDKLSVSAASKFIREFESLKDQAKIAKQGAQAVKDLLKKEKAASTDPDEKAVAAFKGARDRMRVIREIYDDMNAQELSYLLKLSRGEA